MNFWKKLAENNKPFFALAPMLDVTDVAFREIIAKYGKPDILWTEFVSCDGLMSEGREKLMHLLEYTENQRPIVAQLFGSNPENFYYSAKLVKELGFDGIDINMGCPQKNILKQGAGAKLITTPDLAREIIRETKRGAGDLPVSVKTRIGFKKNELETWLPVLLEEKPDAIILHGRTQKEMSKVPADWSIIKQAVEMAKGTGILIVGNGDVQNIEDGKEKAKMSGVDGIMIGRGIFGKPWLFNKDLEARLPSVGKRLEILIEHLELYKKYFGDKGEGRIKPFNLMKKHFGAYVIGFHGAKELRMKLMESEDEDFAIQTLQDYLKK